MAEAGGWSMFIPGLPVAADGGTFDEAVAEMIDAVREYAEDWQERLLDTPITGTTGCWSSWSASAPMSSFATGWRQAGPGSAGAPADALPADLVHLLITRVGLGESEVAAMTKVDAVERLNRFWAGGA